MKIVPVSTEELADESPVGRRPIDLEVRLSKHRQFLSLTMTCRGVYGNKASEEALTFCLSPRGAEQLSDLLEKTVKEYRESL